MQLYEQVSPLQLSPVALCGVHAFPQPAQLLVVLVAVAQPPRSGDEPLVQSANPTSHVYPHFVPLQVVALEFAALQTSPHALQSAVDDRLVSQPLVSGAVVVQSA